MSLVDIAKAAYGSADTERAWLDGLLRAAAPDLDEGLGLIAYRFVRGAGGRVRTLEPVARGVSALTIATFALAMEESPAELLRRAYDDSRPCASFMEVIGEDGARDAKVIVARALSGVLDFVALKAQCTDGTGIVLGIPLPRKWTPTQKQRWDLERVAAHVAAAARLRDEPGSRPDGLPVGTEAVFAPGRGLVHAEGTAKRFSRSITAAASRIERARDTRNEESTLAAWTALLDGRWSIVEHVDFDGRRFLLARSNSPAVSGPLTLTARERQVSAYVALGHSQKLVAYELGLAHSTVETTLHRALRKLGVRSRLELVALLAAARAGLGTVA